MKQRTSRPYDKELLQGLRNQLVEILERLRSDTETLATEALQPSGQDSGFENPADFGSDAFAEELSIERLEDRARLLQDCEAALDRLNGLGDHEYGLCQQCVEEPQHLCPTCPWIPPERLSYLPCALHCVPVQEALEWQRHEALP